MIVEKQKENFWILNWLDRYMIGHKGFIAGGCFKNIFSKDKVKDLDIFFENKDDYNDAVDYFDSMTEGYDGADKQYVEYKFMYQNDKCKAYLNIETNIRIELCCAIYGTAKEVIEKFDFTITKFAYYKEEVEDEIGDFSFEVEKSTHIEYKIVCDENYFEHLYMSRLVVDDKILYPMSTFERMIRYIGYGYNPCKETKIKIARAIKDLNDEQIVASESLYNGMD